MTLHTKLVWQIAQRDKLCWTCLHQAKRLHARLPLTAKQVLPSTAMISDMSDHSKGNVT